MCFKWKRKKQLTLYLTSEPVQNLFEELMFTSIFSVTSSHPNLVSQKHSFESYVYHRSLITIIIEREWVSDSLLVVGEGSDRKWKKSNHGVVTGAWVDPIILPAS